MSTTDLQAQWIWCGGEQRPKNFYLHVRKSFSIPVGVSRVLLRVTADSRYRLFVNGAPVGRGPARCDRRWQCLDQWDITPHIRVGGNVVAALVHHYGEWTFSYMLGRAGFLAEVGIELASGRIVRIGTDGSWRVLPARAWERRLPRMSIQLGYPEVYDARREVGPWTLAEFDDASWEPARVLGPPGMEPWPRLEPRAIPALREEPLKAERVVDTGEVGGARTGHYVDILRVVWSTSNAVGYLATLVWSPVEFAGEIHAGSQDALRLWVNGEQLVSRLVARDPAPDQEIVPVRLRRGWNTVLAKVVQGEGQWHFYFRIEGEGSERLIYSRTKETGPSDTTGPWSLLAPFESGGLARGFETPFGPETDLDLQRSYTGKGGRPITWISAGVTAESMLPSVAMSREPRLPGPPDGIDRLSGLLAPSTPALFRPGAQHGRYALIDFGKEVAGYPVIEITDASGGEIIDVGYGEVLQTPEGEIVSPASGRAGVLNPDRAGVHYADRYVCKPGRQTFQTFDKRAFRYMQIDVRNLKQPLAIGPVSLVLATYPVEYRGSFECSDPLLNRIWDVGRWTLQLNMEDAYTDCPWRERGQWWGDARVQALVNYYAFGDSALVRNGLRQIAQSQTAEGLTMGIYPTDWPYAFLPTFTLLWIVSLRDYYHFSGDASLVGELLPAVERAVRYFERFRSDHGLLRDVPHWLFVDWAPVETAGESAAVNALYFGALMAAAELADKFGRRDAGREYSALAERVRNGMHRWLWVDGLFRDSWSQGAVSAQVSEQANCWAVEFGVAEGGMASSIAAGLFDERRATVQVGTPYFAFYVLGTLARTGRHEAALGYVRERWSRMLDWGATTWWEQWQPTASFCHGWSAGPTHFLQAEILGVKPALPGWAEVAIAPRPCGLARARGQVPTPRGTVSVEWTEEDVLLLATPAPATVTVPFEGEVSVTVEPGGGAAETGKPRYQDGHAVLILRRPGRYRIRRSPGAA